MTGWFRGGAVVALLIGLALSTVTGNAQQSSSVNDLDLSGIKNYLLQHVEALNSGNATMLQYAQGYYELAESYDFDYQRLWDEQGENLVAQLEAARQTWINDSSGNYELSEGIVAGVPSLAYFDVLLDAGPSGEEDPTNALDNSVELPNGDTLESPGSFYHHLTEPALWGTNPAYIGLDADFDGDGNQEIGESLPEANLLLGSVTALNQGGIDLLAAVKAWEPNPADAFTALLTMVPTMNGYFEDWKNSPFVVGEESTQDRFVAVSRLVDVAGILNGLVVTYANLQDAVEAVNPDLSAQIETGLSEMMTFVTGIHDQEEAGTRFTPEQAELFASQIEAMASAVAGQVTQAMALLGIEPTA